MTRAEVVSALVGRGVRQDRAVQYADAFALYHEAAENIRSNGAVCANPRTAAPMPNPYLPILESARKALASIKGVDAGFLWSESVDGSSRSE